MIAAICPEPELLVLDEPTSGLDPIVRREFIQTVIGAYQDGYPGRRTVFVSTHLISEFEGLIDEFTIIDRGRDVLTLDADTARERYQKIHVRLPGDVRRPRLPGRGSCVAREGLEMVVNGNATEVLQALRARAPEALTVESLTLEEIFVSTLQPLGGDAARHDRRGALAAAGALPALTKEIRALLPTYAAAFASIAIGCLSSSYLLIALGLLGFAFGSVTLGAQSFGLEVQPPHARPAPLAADRSAPRVRLQARCSLRHARDADRGHPGLVPMIFLRRAASPHTDPSMLILAAACGLFVAPTLTMICRSTLAGIVFTVAIPGLLCDRSRRRWRDAFMGCTMSSAIDRFRLLVFWRGMLVICAVGALAGWRMFMRLEVIEGHAQLEVPGSLDRRFATPAAASARQHWAWTLVKKELRVQQMAFVVAALFALVMAVADWIERIESGGDETASDRAAATSACSR